MIKQAPLPGPLRGSGGIAAPSTDRYPALLALDTAHLLDRITESLIRADRNTAGFILATSAAPHISPLAALGRLLSAAGTYLHGMGKADQSYLFAAAADTLTHLTEDLNAPARSGTAAQPSAHTVPPQPTPPPTGTPRKRR